MHFQRDLSQFQWSSPNYCVNSPLIENMDLITWRIV